jgi:signal transduction histidine kinase
LLSQQPLRRQIVAVACLLLLPFAGGVLWSANRTRLERQAEVRELVGALAITTAAYVDQYLSDLDSLASSIVHHPCVVDLDRARCRELFTAIAGAQPLLLNVALASPAGDVLASALSASPDAESLPRTHVQEVVATGRPLVSDLVTGAGGTPTVVLGYPVRNGAGPVAGVLGLSVNLLRLGGVLAGIPSSSDSVVILLDPQNRVLTGNRDVERLIGTRFEVIERWGLPQTGLRKSADGIEQFFGEAGVKRAPWIVTAAIPRSVVATSLLPLWRRNLLIVGLALAASLVFALLLAEVMARHINRLRSAVQQIADGNLSPPAIAKVPNFELGQLRDAFVTMAANLRETRDALDRQVEQERKMNEALQSLRRQVVRQERLAAVGVLVSGVAHELNNPLQAILGTAELLERQPGLSVAVLEEVSFVKVQSGRAREIIRNLARFSTQQSGPPALIGLRDVVAEVVQLRQRDLLNAAVALDVQISSDRQVYANFTELEQVTLNFVVNAQQAIENSVPGRGRIQIRVFDTGKKVRLEVRDNGLGVSAEDEPKLFQPFFTTKPVGKGTGLGLSVSYGIIDSYGGAIGYFRNEWEGATFFFELPASDVAAQDDDGPAVLRRPV